ncbi:MAG: RNA polymerase sigma factor [Lachnospiraceae bacterium]|nr:RNA polymerase sigma factor [Lachnospiraceae bacterium]
MHMQKITSEELTRVIMENMSGMYRLAFSIVGNDADAQDAVGDTVVKAYEKIQTLRKKESVQSWLMQILVNNSRNIVKKRRWKLLENEMEDLEDSGAFKSDEMWPLVMELPEEFRIVVALYYYQNFSVKEIGKMLKISEGTVKSRLSRGREKLSKLLE